MSKITLVLDESEVLKIVLALQNQQMRECEIAMELAIGQSEPARQLGFLAHRIREQIALQITKP